MARGSQGLSDPDPAPELPIHPNVRGLLRSPTMAIQEECDRLRAAGRRVYRLGLGQSPFPVPVAVVEELRANATRKEYLPVCGLPELREAVADYHRRRADLPATGDDVLVGPGSKELMFLLQIVYDGEVLIPTPAWVSYAPQARIAGRTVQFLHARPADGWRLTPDALDAFCVAGVPRPRIMVLNYPSNPTGSTYDAAELQALAEVARRHRVVVLSDEIYGELHHRGAHESIARHYPEGTIVASGLSKWCGAGGWRLGTFTFPRALRWLREAMSVVASESYTTTSAPIQYAAVRAFRGGLRIERYLRHARRVLAALAASLVARLAAAGVRLGPPAGAFYLFPDRSALAPQLRERGISTSDELTRRLLAETGVACLPASVFGRPPEELALRLSYVDFDGPRALAAAEAVPPDEALDEAFVRAHCAPTLEAVDRLCGWLTAPVTVMAPPPAADYAPAP